MSEGGEDEGGREEWKKRGRGGERKREILVEKERRWKEERNDGRQKKRERNREGKKKGEKP
jgi:hypothetical protein